MTVGAGIRGLVRGWLPFKPREHADQLWFPLPGGGHVVIAGPCPLTGVEWGFIEQIVRLTKDANTAADAPREGGA